MQELLEQDIIETSEYEAGNGCHMRQSVLPVINEATLGNFTQEDWNHVVYGMTDDLEDMGEEERVYLGYDLGIEGGDYSE